MKVPQVTLFNIIREGKPYKGEPPIFDGFQFVESKITGNDPEDGGGDYEMIIKNVNTNKYYKVEYQGWDVDYESTVTREENGIVVEVIDSDLSEIVVEVFPRTIETIVFETK